MNEEKLEKAAIQYLEQVGQNIAVIVASMKVQNGYKNNLL